MRRFRLRRDQDVTGVSGTGVVAEGVEFADGTVALRWLSETASTAVFASIDDVQKIHGHDGATRVVWVDPPGGVGISVAAHQVFMRPSPPDAGFGAGLAQGFAVGYEHGRRGGHGPLRG